MLSYAYSLSHSKQHAQRTHPLCDLRAQHGWVQAVSSTHNNNNNNNNGGDRRQVHITHINQPEFGAGHVTVD